MNIIEDDTIVDTINTEMTTNDNVESIDMQYQ